MATHLSILDDRATPDSGSNPDAVVMAASRLRTGGMVLVTDDTNRENEADLVMAAEFVTAEQMAFIVRNSTGIVCTPMRSEQCEALALPQMVGDNSDPHRTAFTVSVDAVSTGSGVSASDRARTARALADPTTGPQSLRRPGHVFPLRARPGGVLERAGHTEAAVDLLTIAGLGPVGLIAEVVGDDGEMLRGEGVTRFAAEHDLPVVSVADLIVYRQTTERMVEAVARSYLPTKFGDFTSIVYRSREDGVESFVLTMGDVTLAGAEPRGVLVRVHSECLSGDTFASLKCDCGSQLTQSLEAIAREGCGALVYLRGHEGRGIGLGHKIRAYGLQDEGLDTVDANVALGLPVDARSYRIGVQILADLELRKVRLMTNNPLKVSGLSGSGVEIVERVSMPSLVNEHNARYLHTKRDRLGHLLEDSAFS